MTLKQFIIEFDKPNSIVLLEGKRDVLEADEKKLQELGKLLASKTKHIIFRSGNAPSADQFFSDGVCSIDSKRLQVLTPYDGHRKKTNYAYDTISLDTINLAAEPEIIYQSKQNKKTEKLIDKYVSGERDRFSIKAAYILRDTIKAIGQASSFGIFYDDLSNPKAGGTGHTMDICLKNNIPILDQSSWFSWLAG